MNVKVTLNSSVYFLGDTLFCSISCESGKKQESILWMSAQIYGFVEFDNNWRFRCVNVERPKTPRRLSASGMVDLGSAKNEHHRCLFVTQANILGCDLPVAPNQPLLFIYKVKIPETSETGDILPPTYPPLPINNKLGGSAPLAVSTSVSSIKIRYIISIAIQLTGSNNIQLIEIPLQILSPCQPSSKINCITSAQVGATKEGESMKIAAQDHCAVQSLFFCRGKSIISGYKEASNDLLSLRDMSEQTLATLGAYARELSYFLPPLLQEKQNWIQEQMEDTTQEIGETTRILWELHHSYQQQQNKSISYRVSISDDAIIKISLGRTCFVMGEIIEGVISYESDRKIFQTAVYLNQVEKLNTENCEKITKKGKEIRSTVIAEIFEYSVDTLQSGFSLGIPLEASPEFHTNLVDVYWELKFQFIVESLSGGGGGNITPVEILNWSLPLRVISFDYPRSFLRPQVIDYIIE